MNNLSPKRKLNIMNKLINTTQGLNCKNYSGSILKNSITKNNCVVGDFSRVYESELSDNVRIDRNNFIHQSLIGDHTYTGQSTVIMHSEIGRFCSISWGVTIGAGEHDYNKITTHDFLYNPLSTIKPNEYDELYDRYAQPLEIGNDVWIGANVTIKRGVKIANGAVIGANSVVTKDIPAYAIAVGCPAKVIKFRFTEKQIDEIESIKWWDFSDESLRANYKIFTYKDIDKTIHELKILKKIL